IHKVDDHVPPKALAGAVFGLYSSTDGTGTAVTTCTSAADGTCTFDKVVPGDYSIKEISAPAGYSADTSVKQVTVGFHATVDVGHRRQPRQAHQHQPDQERRRRRPRR